MPESNHFDSIVVGSGISGGWSAKELCEKGLKTRVLERDRMVEHLKDYPTATLNPWQFKNRGQLDAIERVNPIAGGCYAFDETIQHFCKGQRASLCAGKALLWDPWLPGGWKITDLGACYSALE